MNSSDKKLDYGHPGRTYAPWQHTVAWLLVLAAAGEFVVRGPLRKPATLWDFAVIYSAAKVWGEGGNPYDNAQVAQVWARGGGVHTVTTDLSWLPSLVLPSVLTVVWPFTLLPPVAASWAWIAASMLLLILAIAAMLRLARLNALAPPGLCLIAFVLAFGPVHVAMLTGQPALWCAASIVLAVAVEQHPGRRSQIAAGVLLGLATALKPQLGAPFVLYFLVRRNWTTAFWAMGISAAALGIGLWRLQLTGGPWLAHWKANLAGSNGPGGSNDYDFGNKTRDHLVELQMLLWPMLKNRALVSAATGLLCGCASLIYAWFVWRLPRDLPPRVTLLALAPLAVLTLLPTYHRYYDATILLIPMAWVFAEMNRDARGDAEGAADDGTRQHGSYTRLAAVTLILLLAFLMPLAFWTNLIRYHYLQRSVENLAVWNLLLIPYHVWALLGLLGVLLYALAACGFATRKPPRHYSGKYPSLKGSSML